jgi:hypothetical protein
LVEVGTHVELGFGLGPCTTGETSLGPGLWHHPRPGMLVLWDRNFFSYPPWKRLLRRGVHILARVKKNLVLRPLRALADGSYLAKVYRKDHDRQRDRGGIRVRVLRYTLDDPQRVGHADECRLLTTLRDAAARPARELICLCQERWEIEVDIRSIKSTMQMDILRCQTPAMVHKEIRAHLLAYNLLRTAMAVAASASGIEPRQVSFQGAKQLLTAFAPKIEAARPEGRAALIDAMLEAMAYHRVGNRPGRWEPRARKRRPKPGARLTQPRAIAKLPQNRLK